MFKWIVPVLAATLTLPTTVAAQQSFAPIEAKVDAPWTHGATGVILPTAIAGLPRTNIAQIGEGEWDVAGAFELPGRVTVLTVYVYQAAAPSVPLWFEEARRVIEMPQARYGQLSAFAPPTTFVPRGATVESGLRATWAGTASYTSTALAVAPLNGSWILKLRLSAQDKTAAELDALLTRIIAELQLPANTATAPAQIVASCTTSLPTLTPAKPVGSAAAAALFGAFGTMLAEQAAAKGDAGDQHGDQAYCRDAALSSTFTVYRRDGSTDGYLLSLGDSGRAAIVGRDGLALLLSKSKTPKASYAVSHVEPGTITNFGSYDRLPPPAQLIAIVDSNRWRSRTTRAATDNDVSVNGDMMK